MGNRDIEGPIHRAVIADLLDYNSESGSLTWRHRPKSMFPYRGTALSWNNRCAGKPALNCLNKGYRVGNFCGRMVSAHRIIWILVYDENPDEIDHINGNRSDNRLCNLRAVSRTENARNMKAPSGGKSGHIGVRAGKAGKWIAYIKVNSKQIHLGTYDLFDDAVAARKSAETTYGFHENHGRQK